MEGEILFFETDTIEMLSQTCTRFIELSQLHSYTIQVCAPGHIEGCHFVIGIWWDCLRLIPRRPINHMDIHMAKHRFQNFPKPNINISWPGVEWRPLNFNVKSWIHSSYWTGGSKNESKTQWCEDFLGSGSTFFFRVVLNVFVRIPMIVWTIQSDYFDHVWNIEHNTLLNWLT